MNDNGAATLAATGFLQNGYLLVGAALIALALAVTVIVLAILSRSRAYLLLGAVCAVLAIIGVTIAMFAANTPTSNGPGTGGMTAPVYLR